MNEQKENQPVPLETESASPEQRHRPRRRFPRRRYRDRGDRFRRSDSESPNSSSTNADPSGETAGVETLDRPASAGRQTGEGVAGTRERGQAEPELGEGSIVTTGKRSG